MQQLPPSFLTQVSTSDSNTTLPTRSAMPIGSANRYHAGLRISDGVVYADPTVPVNSHAKVKLDLINQSDMELVQFAKKHMSMISDNPLFPDPRPANLAFHSLVCHFHEAINEVELAKLAVTHAVASRNAIRQQLTDAFNQRASYVQDASNGHPSAILSAGLPLQKQRQPKGQLPWPTNFRINLGEVAGTMLLRWDSVPGNEGYLLRWSPDQTPRQWVNLNRCGRPKQFLEELTIGYTYIFQVATAGGSGGQSAWSPEVQRTAA
jgi:hypothetical protein